VKNDLSLAKETAIVAGKSYAVERILSKIIIT